MAVKVFRSEKDSEYLRELINILANIPGPAKGTEIRKLYDRMVADDKIEELQTHVVRDFLVNKRAIS